MSKKKTRTPVYHHGDDYKVFRDFLKKEKKDFVVSQTLRTVKIEVDGKGYLFSDSKITIPEMQLQKRMKKQIENVEIPFNLNIMDYTTRYYSFAHSLQNIEGMSGVIHEFDNVMELDITMAYYQAAFNLGYITQEFFNRCKVLPKHWRLRLIGCIATAKDIFTYKNGKLADHKIIKDKKGRRAWRNIVDYVDSCMMDVKEILGKDFLFYWVDGIFIDTRKTDKLKLLNLANIIFKRNKFEFSIVHIPKMEVVNIDGASQILISLDNGKKKPYFIARENTKAYYFEQDLN